MLGGVDYAEIDYSNGEKIDTTAYFAGADARFSDDSGYFGGVAAVGGISRNTIQQPVSLGIGLLEEHADYDASFFAVAGRIGKRIELAGANAMRLTASGSYVAEWTDAYSYDGLVAGLYEVDNHYAQALDGRLEVAFERRHNIARGGVLEAFTGLLGHYQLSGEQGFLLDNLLPFDIPDPSVEAYAGFVGAGITARIGFNGGSAPAFRPPIRPTKLKPLPDT